MSASDQTGGQPYRLIITRRNATETLVLPCGSGWVLPHLELRPGRLAEQLTAGTRHNWKIESYCLFADNSSGRLEDAPAQNYAVMESSAHNDHAPPGTFWMTSAAAIRKGVLPDQDHLTANNALQELRRYSASPRLAPFARTGWLPELLAWTQQQVGPLGLRLTARFRQLNASPSFSLIRMETDGPAVWFKATGEPNRRELAITATLARLFPGYVPEVWGTHPLWNAWLAPETPGSTLDAPANVSAWATAATRLAELQIASLGKTTELLKSGCGDRRIEKLAQQVDPFIALMKEIMAAQKKNPPAALTNSELDALREELMSACSAIQRLHLPDALGHLDFNPGNIRLSGGTCFFLDWAEGCIANPLITFEYLREHFRRHCSSVATAGQRICSAYLEPWPSLLSSALLRGLSVSPLLSAFAYATAGDTWHRSDVARNANLCGYLRSLTRRMHREVLLMTQRKELCLA